MGIDGNLTRKQFLGAVAVLAASPKAALAGIKEPLQDPAPGVGLSDLASGDKLAGIALTDARHKQALGVVKTNVANFNSVRALKLDNAVEPNLVFTPRGRQPKASKTTRVSVQAKAAGALGSSEDIAYSSLVDLAEAIRAKKISPVELTELYLKRLDAYGDKLKCVITLTPELARRQAKKCEQEIMSGHYRGPLHGVPYGIKDLFAVEGYRTTWGAEAFKEQVIDHDAAVVEKLTEAGAICVAKTSCGALAYDDVWWGGQTKNPWNTKQGSSGSSAGSACSTAAGLVGFSIGTETLGSIISPSNRCRVTGLRPTYGRVSRYGGMDLTWTMDKVGPICRTAQDCAVVLGAIHGADPRDIASVDRPYRFSPQVDLKRLKVGVLTGDKENPIETADWAKELSKMGADLKPIQFSTPPEGIWALLVAEASAFFEELSRTEGIDKIGKLWPAEFLGARYLPAVEYINAHRARAVMAAKFEEEFGDFDVVVTDHYWDDIFTTCNGTGHPQCIIPWGVSDKNEPLSVSVVGRLYDEPTIASVAWRLQQTRNFHTLRPDASSW